MHLSRTCISRARKKKCISVSVSAIGERGGGKKTSPSSAASALLEAFEAPLLLAPDKKKES
jgi:hypothetical protein